MDLKDFEPYLTGLVSDILAAGGVVGAARIGGGLWIGAVDQAPDEGDLYLEGSIRRSQAVAARLHLAAAASINNASWTAIAWDTVDQNEPGMWAAGSPARIVCQVDGLYLVAFNAVFAANGSGIRIFGARLNGTNYLAETEVMSPSAGNTGVGNVAALVPLQAGDYIEGMVYQSSGGSLNVGGSAETNIGVVRMA